LSGYGVIGDVVIADAVIADTAITDTAITDTVITDKVITDTVITDVMWQSRERSAGFMVNRGAWGHRGSPIRSSRMRRGHH
jgi:hypothetical protein